MKKALLLFAVIIALASCGKESVQPNMFGTWELRHVGGGWGININHEAGNGDKYLFKSDSTYTRYKDNKVEGQGNYSVKILSTENGYQHGSIYFSHLNYTDAFAFKPGSVVIGTSAADGPTYEYTRISR